MGLSKLLRSARPELLLVAFAGVLALGIVRGGTSVSGFWDLRKRSDVLGQTVASLRAENEDLAAEINRLKSSPSYARKVLRDKYHVTDPDESIIFFAE